MKKFLKKIFDSGASEDDEILPVKSSVKKPVYNDETKFLVFDIGSDNCRAGFSADDEPRFQCPTNEDLGENNIPNCTYGEISDFTGYGKLIEKCEDKLECKLKDYGVLFCDQPFTSMTTRKRRMEIAFENFKVLGCCSRISPVMNLYAAGRVTGTVLELGVVSSIAALYEGYILTETVKRVDFGGSDVTKELKMLLEKHNIDVADSSLQSIKEKLCYVSDDYAKDMKQSTFEKEEYELVDGKKVSIPQNILFESSEILFSTKMKVISKSGKSAEKGFGEFSSQYIKNLDTKYKKELCSAFLVFGGSSKLKKFSSRLEKELKSNEEKLKMYDSYENTNCWTGASIESSLSTFSGKYTTKKQYDENGIDRELKRYMIFSNKSD